MEIPGESRGVGSSGSGPVEGEEALEFLPEHLPGRFGPGEQMVVAVQRDHPGILDQSREFLSEPHGYPVVVA